MSDTFTRDRDGKKFRDFLHQEFGDSATGTEHYHIEPIPTPPQTEAEILAEMEAEIARACWDHCRGSAIASEQRTARAIVAAVQKLREGK